MYILLIERCRTDNVLYQWYLSMH